MAGTLGPAEMAILGSTIAWRVEKDGDSPSRLTQANEPDAGYQITSQGDNPRYWTAYAPGGTDSTRQLWSGAGSLGVAHCIRACERHAQASANHSPQR